jgi:hypothetical protein
MTDLPDIWQYKTSANGRTVLASNNPHYCSHRQSLLKGAKDQQANRRIENPIDEIKNQPKRLGTFITTANA